MHVARVCAMPNSDVYPFVLTHTWGKTERKSKQGKPWSWVLLHHSLCTFLLHGTMWLEDWKNRRLTKLFECWSPDYTKKKLKRWFYSCQLVLLLCSLTVTFLYNEHLCIWKINPSCKKDCAKIVPIILQCILLMSNKIQLWEFLNSCLSNCGLQQEEEKTYQTSLVQILPQLVLGYWF